MFRRQRADIAVRTLPQLPLLPTIENPLSEFSQP